MRVMFVGTLSTESLDKVVHSNLCRLCEVLAITGVQFAIRWPRREGHDFEPIDYVVYSCLEDAARRNSIRLRDDDLLVIKEPGAEAELPIELPHTSYTVSAPYRIDFYRQILALTDLVIGVGGKDGLLRISMLSEYSWKPLFFLPGSGGTAEILWAEFFTKNYQLQCFSEAQVQELRQTPYLSTADPFYGSKVYRRLQIIYEAVGGHRPKSEREILTLDGISLSEFRAALGRLSLGVWLTLVPLLVTLLSVAYYLGTKDFLKTVGQRLGLGE